MCETVFFGLCPLSKSAFFKLWSEDHRLSMAIYPVVRGGPQAVLEDKVIAKIVSDTEGMKNTSIHVCAKTACFC
jgi:hypothetical protein